ncbi:hypothetical protein Trihar35433_2340 [Trichoderma harzianum]|nr:hypothetical protein Trihar35433_2340 [Trichoderma harzianum]
MSTDDLSTHLADSGITMRSDSEQYSPGDEVSSPSSSNSPVILYKPPTAWSLIRSAAINLVLPFINGMMLGFGELFAHEAAFRFSLFLEDEPTPLAQASKSVNDQSDPGLH